MISQYFARLDSAFLLSTEHRPNDVKGAQMTHLLQRSPASPYYIKVQLTEWPHISTLAVLIPEPHSGFLQSVGRFLQS
jgi:hypothetical protein